METRDACETVSVSLRVCSLGDHPELLRIVEEPDVGGWLLAGVRPHAKFYLDPRPGSGAGPLFVAETGRRIVGGGRIEFEGFSYFVCRNEWGKGYGSRIANLMLAEYRRRHPSAPAVLSIRRDNRASIRIVERLGFRFAGLNGSDPVTLKFVSNPVANLAD